MKSLFIAAALLVAGAVARPGGYTGFGGVYKTMNAAKKAAKEAIFDDITLKDSTGGNRNERKALYVPTFFTGVPQTNLHPVAAAHVEQDRFERDANTYEQQTFYREYSPSSRAIY